MQNAPQNAAPASEEEIYQFLLAQIDSVPHLEALLLLWRARPKAWLAEEIAARLFVQAPQARSILGDLVRRNLVLQQNDSKLYSYFASPGNDRIVASVASAYRTDLIRISTTIHSKASSGVLEFARAFEFNRRRNPK